MKRDCGDETKRTYIDSKKDPISSPSISEQCKFTYESATGLLSAPHEKGPSQDHPKKRPHQCGAKVRKSQKHL